MDAQGGWGGPSVSYPTLPPPPPGSHAFSGDAFRSASVPGGSAYPSLPVGPPPVVPSRLDAPSAPWVSSSPSAAMGASEDYFTDADVVPYSAGGAEPYGSRGTGSGSYWGSGPSSETNSNQLVRIDVPQISQKAPQTQSSKKGGSDSLFRTEAAHSSVQDGVHIFRVQLLGDSGDSGPKDVVCKIGLDGVRIAEAESGRVMRIYPLDIITRWEVKDPTVFTFWVKTSVEVDQRAVRLKSNSATTSLILDTLTAACIQVFEMIGKEKGDGGAEEGAKKPGVSSGSGASTQPSNFMEWMRKSSAPAAPAPVVEKHHWVPDEDVTRCSSCEAEFGTFLRRHHCRNCGNVFCDKCSRGRTPLTSDVGAPSVRVCDACLAEVTQRLSFEKEKAEEEGGAAGGSSAALGPASSSIPSHDELMKRLEDHLKRSGSISGSVSQPHEAETPKDRGSGSGRKTEPALPPALSGSLPAEVHSSAGSEGSMRRPGAGSSSFKTSSSSFAPSPGATWLSTCAFCTSVALVSGADPRCPTCGSPASAPPAPAPAPAPAPVPPAHSAPLPVSSYPAPPSYSYPPPPPALNDPPHLWPSPGSTPAPAPGHVAVSQAPARKREVVACPSCTAHLEVEVPAVGTETMQCGVCHQPFLIGSA